jgi:RimJ/RimL family protein N-acetyltransferase
MTIPELATDRLVLRAFTSADAEGIRDLAGSREVAATIDGIPNPYPEPAAGVWIASHAFDAEAGTSYTWAITRRHDATLIGAVAVYIEIEHQRGGIRYWAGRPYWNQGFITEAAQCVVAHAFTSLAIHRIQAFCIPVNTGSVRVLEKLGFRHEGVLRDYVYKWEHFEDRAVYGLLKHEWKYCGAEN